MNCPIERGGCGKKLQWGDGAFCSECMTKTRAQQYSYQYVAVVLGTDGFKYSVSHRGIEKETYIIDTAEKFYGKKMERVIEYR